MKTRRWKRRCLSWIGRRIVLRADDDRAQALAYVRGWDDCHATRCVEEDSGQLDLRAPWRAGVGLSHRRHRLAVRGGDKAQVIARAPSPMTLYSSVRRAPTGMGRRNSTVSGRVIESS